MKFGEFLKLSRNINHLKLTKASEMMGISTSYLCSLENGSRTAPSFDTLKKMADVLKLDDNARYQLFDLAAESKNPPALADDLNAYICKIPQIRGILRYSMECQLTENDWEVISKFVKKNYFY